MIFVYLAHQQKNNLSIFFRLLVFPYHDVKIIMKKSHIYLIELYFDRVLIQCRIKTRVTMQRLIMTPTYYDATL